MLEGEQGWGGGGGRLGPWRKTPQVRVWWAVGAQSLSAEMGGRELCLRRGTSGTAGPSSPGGQLQGGLEGGRPGPGRRPRGI